jgi:pyridinium-3,5-biscarboxylic acid mononucleotide synthase
VAARSAGRRPSRARQEVAIGDFARYDAGRGARTGAPEIILGEGKSLEHLLGLLKGLHRRGRGALVSRPTRAHRAALGRAARAGLPITFEAGGRIARLAGPIAEGIAPGTIAVVTAGTADVPTAEEAVCVLRAIGVEVVTSYDVGVAGIHRLQRALARLERRRPAAYLVFAGREGALPTVVAGLVRAPVIGIPTSVGYGRGGRGEAALLAMLQSCAPVAVVNIDAAVPAALFAVQLLAAPRGPVPRPRRPARGTAF